MKRIMSLAVVTVLCLGLSGCVGKFVTSNIYHDENKKSTLKYVYEPKLNIINTAEVGANMYYKSYLYYDNTYIVKIQNSIIRKKSNINIDKSQLINRENIALYTWSNNEKQNIKSICTPDQKRQFVCISDINNIGSFTHLSDLIRMHNIKLLDKPVKYKLLPSPPSFKAQSFRYEVLFQGKIGNKIKISFREFKENMARPAFTQNIDYELNKDGTTIIGFKGLRIEVIKVTNMDITYKVIKDYK